MAPRVELSNGINGHVETGISSDKPRFLIVGAGSRGNAYARAVTDSGLGVIAAVADPIEFKRSTLGSRYIWPKSKPTFAQAFDDWKNFLAYERQRREHERAGTEAEPGIDGVFVCVLDEQHMEVVTGLAPLGLHIMSEKPLATTLADCLRIQQSLRTGPESIFAIGHVLRYSPHNMLLRHLLLERKVVGDVLSIEHTEPVGWWHFSHSFVRGNWRKESKTAPSLMTKSCHDIDFILWLLCSPPPGSTQKPHLPSTFSSAGSLKEFRRERKPKEAGNATNCLSCKLQDTCMYSADRIYHHKHLNKGNAKWPVHIVNPEVEALWEEEQYSQAHNKLMGSLSEDYDTKTTPVQDIEGRPWYGRCVWECDNDVVDDQYVTISWDDDPLPETGLEGRGAKTANFHMIAQTLSQCERRGRIYGRTGEISYDSKSITVHDFTNDTTKTYNPEVPKNSHHGGGDDGLATQFVKAVDAVKSKKMAVKDAQVEFMGCTIEEIIRSHAAVFCAEEARLNKKVIDWHQWWSERVEPQLKGKA